MLSERERKRTKRQITYHTLKIRSKHLIEKAFHFLISPLTIFVSTLIGTPGKSPRRVLVVATTLRIGDVITTQPAVREIRKKYPDSEIDILVDEFLTGLAGSVLDVDRAVGFDRSLSILKTIRFIFDLRKNHYDIAYVLVTDFKNIILPFLLSIPRRISYNFNGRGHPSTIRSKPPDTMNLPGFLYPENYDEVHITETWMNLVDDEKEVGELEFKKSLLKEIPDGLKVLDSYVVLHPSTDEESYLWVTDRWKEIAKKITDSGFKVVLTGSKRDRDITELISYNFDSRVVDVAGNTDLKEFISIIAKAELVITLDTSAGHIASLTGTPPVVLFGPGDETIWKPLGDRSVAVRGESPCSICKKPVCFQKVHHCMEAISVEHLWEVIKPLLH